jgi:hypothetical protein
MLKILINTFYKNKKSKLYFGDHVIVLNNLLYGYGESIYYVLLTYSILPPSRKSVVSRASQTTLLLGWKEL